MKPIQRSRETRPAQLALTTVALTGILVLASAAGADELPPMPQPAHAVYSEQPDDPYVPSPRDAHPRSPATRFGSGSFSNVQVNVDGNGMNIVGDAANEPSMAVDASDPDRIVIGWRQFDTIASNFRQAGYGYTTDGGLTWTFPGVIEPGIFRSDPVLDSDAHGGVYYNSLTVDGSDYTCDVYASTQGGATWDSGSFAQGGDKQWMAIDRSGTIGDGNIYAAWNGFFSSCPPGFFTRSTNGTDFEPCITVPDDPFWGTLTVGPAGELYVIGSTGSDFVVAKSSNARNPFAPAIVWDFASPFSLGGSIDNGTGPNPGGLLGQTWIAADQNGSNVYALCSVNPPGSDPLDVKFARSTDGGATWGSPVRINDDAGTDWQWFGTMSVAPAGRIDAVWLDTRDGPGAYGSSLYYSNSTDEGVTWSANERLSGSFDPHLGWPNQNKMGDYFHMVSDDAGFALAWAATFNGEQDVYFGRKVVAPVAVAEANVPVPDTLLRSHPNPFDAGTTVRYEVPRDAVVTLNVYDAAGRLVRSLVSGEHRAAGVYEAHVDGGELPSGVYFYRLTAGEFRETSKV
ncbi:T9SS type A sorting domain-containing protein, partial [bacterium]|nr:T9SS type A sorting domain-containing protein [bacterium]